MLKKFLQYSKSLKSNADTCKTMNISGIEIEVVKKNIKNMHLSVRPPNGTVRISAPIFISDETIRLFAVSKITWLKRQIEKYQNQPNQSEHEYASGESHYFWGNSYLLNVVNVPAKVTGNANENSKVNICGNKMTLAVSAKNTCIQREKILNAWYRTQLKAKLPTLFEKWESIIGVYAKEVKIRDMRTRWGTCNIFAHRIWINLQLVKKPPQCLEYVVVHELVHLLEKSHNKRFKVLMDKFLPDWRTRKEELHRFIIDEYVAKKDTD